MKTASKRAIQIKAEITGDLIGNKIADKILIWSTPVNICWSSRRLLDMS